jgi:hypothetical protein
MVNGIDPTKDLISVHVPQVLMIRCCVDKTESPHQEVALELCNALPKLLLDWHYECRSKVAVHVKNNVAWPIPFIEAGGIQDPERVPGNREAFIE